MRENIDKLIAAVALAQPHHTIFVPVRTPLQNSVHRFLRSQGSLWLEPAACLA